MSKDQGTRRYLDIPGEKTLIYTFKFNMDLPPPVPPPKTMYIPLDPERYIKPKLTLFHVKRKANLLADINLSIPVDEVNMRPELYNPAPDAKIELSDKDRELLEERPQKEVKKEPSAKAQTTNGKSQNTTQKDKDAGSKEQPTAAKAKQPEANTKKPEAAQVPKKKEEQKKLSIDEYVKKSFETASSYTVGTKHPSKDGLQCQEVFEIVPDLNNIITELYALKTEVSIETFKSKENLIKFETDLDQKPILSVYMNVPLGETDGNMEEENQVKEEAKPKLEFDQDPLLKRVENFEHTGNYIYSHPKPHGAIKRDLLLSLHKNNGKALIYQPHSLIVKKKKVLFMSKTLKKEDDSDDERKPAEQKKTIKILKRNVDKEELLLKKRKFQELHLENTPLYKKNNKELENYKEEEEDELEILRKKFAVEEEEHEDEEEEEEKEQEKIEEEEEEEHKPKEEEEDRIKDEDIEEMEAAFNEESEHEEEQKAASPQQVKKEQNEPMEEEVQYKEEEPEAKPAKANSDDEDAQELADFFADSDEDD